MITANIHLHPQQSLKTKVIPAKDEKRAHERQCYGLPIQFSYFNKKHHFDAQTINHCTNGMCIRSDFFVKPGCTIFIMVKKIPSEKRSATDAYNNLPLITIAEVKWCRPISDENDYSYEIGVKYHQVGY